MNQSLLLILWSSSAVAALSGTACSAVDHTVGSGEHGLNSIGPEDTKRPWSDDILRECVGDPDVPTRGVDYCAAALHTSEASAYSVTLVVDQSVRMALPLGEGDVSRWQAVRQGLVDFQRSYDPVDGSTVQLVFAAASAGDTCSSGAYTGSSFPAALAADGIDAAFAQTSPVGEANPLLPAVESALGSLEAEPLTPTVSGVDQKAVVVITASAPDTCPDADARQALADVVRPFAMPGSSRIATYVVDLGGNAGLDSVAEAGGTESAITISGGDVAAQVNQAMRNALDALRYWPDCSFPLYSDDEEMLSTGLLHLSTDAGLEYVPLLDGPEQCADSPHGGWYLLSMPPESDIFGQFCDCSCARAARFRVSYGASFACPSDG